MSEPAPVTTREAVLSSLLAHACIIILVLMFPNLFTWKGRPLFSSADPNAPVPIEFIQPLSRPPSASLGDAGKRKVGEPRPPDAPPPTNDEPYSRGNTRNRFVAPPQPEHARPSPRPGGSGSSEPSQQQTVASNEPKGTDEALQRGEASEPDSATGRPFYVPQRGSGGSEDKGAALKQALGKMSTGMSGGAPLKFDNPSGGLSGPLGGLSFDTPGFDWGPYARKIYWIIWTNWTRGWPPAAWAGLKGIVTVHFTIWKDGHISDITVLDPSGTPAFDTCASLALEASSPLPALPEDFPKESEGITARFLNNTDEMDR